MEVNVAVSPSVLKTTDLEPYDSVVQDKTSPTFILVVFVPLSVTIIVYCCNISLEFNAILSVLPMCCNTPIELPVNEIDPCIRGHCDV